MNDVAIVAPEPGTNPGQPWRIDGSKVKWWPHKDTAEDAAQAIGWPKTSVSRVMTRFQFGWALWSDGGLLSCASYEALLADRSQRRPAGGVS